MKNRSMLDRRQDLLGLASSCFTETQCTWCGVRVSGCSTPMGGVISIVYNNVAHVGHCHPHVVEA